MGLPKVWRGLNAGPYTPPPSLVYPQLCLARTVIAIRRFYQAGRSQPNEAAKCPEPLCPTSVLPSLGEMSTISSEGVTPPSSLLRAHVPLPLGSPLLQHLTSFEESLQVVRSPCCPRELPDAISESLSLDAGSPTPAVPPCALTCFFHGVIGLPHDTNGSAPASVPRITTSRRIFFRGCRYFVMFRPPSLLAPQIVPTAAILPQGSRGFYVRAYRALLPPHAPDMLQHVPVWLNRGDSQKHSG